ncbi:MAG: hypothetical protein ACF8R9_01600 [Phycisphaerales bacterium JB054]
MAKKKSKAKSRRAAKPDRMAWAASPGLRLGAVVVGALVGLGAAGWGAATVHARAGEILASEPTTVEIEWPTLGGADQTWLGEGLREQIVEQIDTQLVGRSLDAGALASVGEMLAASGWFDTEPRVARTGDSTIRVSGVWREPACAVRVNGRDYPLDWRGRPFPIEYEAGTSGLRVLVGVRAQVPLDAVGTLDVINPWPGEDVEAGLGLLAPLLREPFAGQVAGVDVAEYFTLGRLSIVTDRDSRVIWGGRFGEFVPGEATTKQKMERLRAAASNPMYERRIDSGAQRLDISGEHLILDRTGTP